MITFRGCIQDSSSGELVLKQLLKEMSIPRSKHVSQVWLSMVYQMKAWYPQLSFNTKVMTQLTWKNVKLEDSTDLKEQFTQLKEYLMNALQLSPVDPNENIELYTNGNRT